MCCSDEYLKPVITSHPTSRVALKDGTLNLTCRALTSSRSVLTVLWKKDHMVSTCYLLTAVEIYHRHRSHQMYYNVNVD